jgi:hypothetical protein
MTTRIAVAIFSVVFATAAVHAQTVFVTPAPADSAEEPTSMPDFCAERDVNCVLDTGAPRRAVVGALIGQTPGATTTAPQAPAGSAASSAAFAGSAGAIGSNRSAGSAGGR